MANNPFAPSPWESIEGITKKATPPVKRAVADVVKDVQQAVMGDGGMGAVEKGAPDQKQSSQALAKNVAVADVKNLQLARQNLARINAEVRQARAERMKKYQEKIQMQEQAKTQKREEKVVAQQKKETVLQKLIKSRQGTKEAIQRVSG